MSSLLVKSHAPTEGSEVLKVTPQSANWKYVGFSVHQLQAGEKFESEEEARELCLVILRGKVDVTAGDHQFTDIGDRLTVFEEKSPYAVYIPENTAFSISANTEAEVALCTAPANSGHSVRLITPDAIPLEVRGEGTNQRYVRAILPESEEADSLLIFEVITPSGNWSSYPPHKHDTDKIPEESSLEETYYYHINPQQGFAFQRVYTDDRSLDETMSVEHGDCVLVPEGYHPVGAPHGYEVYYLNVMAGPQRTWIFKNDPDHEWIVEK